MADLRWLWHRLQAMSLGEMVLRAREQWRRWTDARLTRDWGMAKLECAGRYPKLPPRTQATEEVRRALRRDSERIRSGHWTLFGHLDVRVDDPPRWHRDYLAGKEPATTRSGFFLDHRRVPDGGDIKLIWELSRWQTITRLAMAAYVNEEEGAGEKGVRWLEDWVGKNLPYRGWNWCSALESGLRLAQFTWIDALLAERAEAWGIDAELETLRYEILPAHVWHVWRHRSFGTSANNHLLGELTGLILATVRWPALARWGAPLSRLQELWEQEVLAQFAGDGGNREQALHYHLFAWELCWHARQALEAAGCTIRAAAEDRLLEAERFYSGVQVRREPWDYGDSDSGFVLPAFGSADTAKSEWHDYLAGAEGGSQLRYWHGEPTSGRRRGKTAASAMQLQVGAWRLYPESGIAVCETGGWRLRWDLSPLGYLRPAAHGHMDALHLSIWHSERAVVVDPGTGAYYADGTLRAWLASGRAHNGPCLKGEPFPRRIGTFLWSGSHENPTWEAVGREAAAGIEARQSGGGTAAAREKTGDGTGEGLRGCVRLPGGVLRRTIRKAEAGDGWIVTDACETTPGAVEFTVRWQFAPGIRIKRLGERRFELSREEELMEVVVGSEWVEVKLIETEADREGEEPLAGVVSAGFRQTSFAACLVLKGRGSESGSDKPCLFRSTFLASRRA